MNTPYEAIYALTKQLPKLQVTSFGERTPCKIDNVKTEEDLFKTGLKEIHIRPVSGFAGGEGGLGQILIGGLKIIAGAVLMNVPGFQQIGAALIVNGVVDIMGGIAQLLSPQPKMKTKEEEEATKNRYLGAPQNTVGMNVVIPRGYGRALAAGHFLSFDMQATEVL